MRRTTGRHRDDGCHAWSRPLTGGRRVAQDARSAAPSAGPPAQDVNMLLLPKFLGILPFDLANKGAQEAAAELGTPRAFDYTGPTAENSVAGQIEQVTNAPTQGFNVVMLSNNAGDQIAPAAVAAQEAGTKVVTWDSPIPSAEGESFFVAQVDFNEIGGHRGHGPLEPAAPTAASSRSSRRRRTRPTRTPGTRLPRPRSGDPKYANIELVETVYGNDESEESYNQAVALIDKYPD